MGYNPRSKITWRVKDIVGIAQGRQRNKFDCNIVVSGDRGNGKTEIKGSKVLMSSGEWKNVEDIKINDEVISPLENGSFIFSKVINLHSRYEKNIYEVREQTRHKKLLYSCAYNHIIPIIKRTSKRTSSDDITPRIYKRTLFNMEAEKVFKIKDKSSHICSFTTTAYEFKDKKECSLDAYSLGIYLGNGSFTDCLIPKEALQSSINYRLKLLAGLIDTGGYISKNNQITYCSKSKQLIEDIKDLVFSLGGYAIIREIYKRCQSFKEKRLYYDISIQFKNPKIIPLKVKSKYERLKKRTIEPRNIAIKLYKGKPNMVYGFELDSPSGWYITDNYMITHNSTLLVKFLYLTKKYNPKKHQVYSREGVIKLLATEHFGICFDDEAINSGYKRDFQNKGQQELIKIITAYRDNFNIYCSALPNFFSLDKDLRDLTFIHIHVIERGIAVLHMPIQGRLYSLDKWDSRNNAQLEDKWNKAKANNPDFRIPYHKLSTFRGYVFFDDLTPKQRELYEEIKKEKRKDAFNKYIDKPKEEDFYEKCLKLILEKKITKDGLIQMCMVDNRDYKNTLQKLNRMLKKITTDESRNLSDYLFTSAKVHKEEEIEKNKAEIENLIPDF
jgi:hypothetical protein